MPYFSRLTDIVTCQLTELLRQEDDPATALAGIIAEMEEGLAGARRSVATARRALQRIEEEWDEHQQQIESWTTAARTALSAGDEQQARLFLLRKQEAEDLATGLERQREAARATLEHLSTLQRAIEARLAEAQRRHNALLAGSVGEAEAEAVSVKTDDLSRLKQLDAERSRRLEEELESLRRELQ